MASSKLQEKDIESELVYSDDASGNSHSDSDSTGCYVGNKMLGRSRSERKPTDKSVLLRKMRTSLSGIIKRKPGKDLKERSPHKPINTVDTAGCADQTCRIISKRNISDSNRIKSPKVETSSSLSSVKHKDSQNKCLESVWKKIEPRQNFIISENNKRSNGKDLNFSINRDDSKNNSISQLAKNHISNLNHSSRSENKSGTVNDQVSLKVEGSPGGKNISNMNLGRKSICRDLFSQKAKCTTTSEKHNKNCKFVSDKVVGSPSKPGKALKDTVEDKLNDHIHKTRKNPFLHQSSDSEDSDYPSITEKRNNILNRIFPQQTNEFANSKINDYQKKDIYKVEDSKNKHILTSSDSESTSDNSLAEKRRQILNRIFPQRSRDFVLSKVDEQTDYFSSSKRKSKDYARKQLKKLQKTSSSNTIEGKVNDGKKKISLNASNAIKSAFELPRSTLSKLYRKSNEEGESLSYESDKDMDFSKQHKTDSNIHAVWSERKYVVPEFEEIKSNSIVIQNRSTRDIANSKINNDVETDSSNIRSLPEKKNKSYKLTACRNKDIDFSKKHKKDSKIHAVWSEKKYTIPQLDEIKSNSTVIQNSANSKISNDKKTGSCNIRGLPEMKNKSFMSHRKDNLLTSSDSEDSNKISPGDKRKRILNRIFPQSEVSSSNIIQGKYKVGKEMTILGCEVTDFFQVKGLSKKKKDSMNYKKNNLPSFCNSEESIKVSLDDDFALLEVDNGQANSFSRCKNNSSLNLTTGTKVVDLPRNSTSKLYSKIKEDESFSFESDEEHSKPIEEKSKKKSLRSKKTNAVPELKEKDVLPKECNLSRKRRADNDDPEVKPSKIPCKSPLKSINSIPQSSSKKSSNLNNSQDNLLSPESCCEKNNKCTPTRVCKKSDFEHSKVFSAKKNLFSPSKVSDFPKRLSVSLTSYPTTKGKETYYSSLTPNTGEINETNKIFSTNTISSERLNKTPQKINIKNQDSYELKTSLKESNITPVKLRDTFSDALDSAQKDKMNTSNIVKLSSGSTVNKSSSSKEIKVSTPTKNTPSKLDRELKYLSIDMVDQNTKSPGRQIKRKSRVASLNLQRDTNQVAENEELSKHDRDLDSCTVSLRSAETTTLSSKANQVSTSTKETKSKKQKCLSDQASKVLSTPTKIEISQSSCNLQLNETPRKNKMEIQDGSDSEVSFEEPNKTLGKVSDSFSSSDKNNSNEKFTIDYELSFSKRNLDAIDSSSKNKTDHVSNSDSDSTVNKTPLSNKTKVTTPKEKMPSRVNRNLICLNIDMNDQNPTSPKRQIKRKAGIESLNLQRAIEQIDEVDELSNEDSDSDNCASINSKETTKSPRKNRQNPNFIEEKLCNSKFNLSKIESKRLQIDMNDSFYKSSEDKSPIFQRTTRLKSTNKSSPNRLGGISDKRMKSENLFENDKEARKCKSPTKSHLTPNKTDSSISYGNSFSPRSLKSSKISNHAQVSSPLQKQHASVTTPISKKSTGRGFLTPSMARKEREDKGKIEDDLDTTRRQLHISTIPKSLPCRDAEFSQIKSFLLRKIEHSAGGCMYISGVPGTGKTATVHAVIRSLQEEADKGEVPEFDFVEVNGLRLTEPKQAYVRIHQALTDHKLAPDQAQQLLNKRFSGSCKRSTIILVDELDYLCNRRQDVVYNILDWPSKSSSRLVVLAISNTMDLPERTLKGRVTSRMGLTRLAFQPYSHHQLREIVCDRLSGTATFHPDAVQLVARKVAAVSGDARRALDICRRTTELVVSKGGGQVTASHVEQALTQIFSGPRVQVIQSLGRLAQLVLRALRDVNERTGVDETTAGQVYRHLEQICALEGCPLPSVGSVLQTCVSLVGLGLMVAEKGRLDVCRKMSLNVSSDDIHYALESLKSL